MNKYQTLYEQSSCSTSIFPCEPEQCGDVFRPPMLRFDQRINMIVRQDCKNAIGGLPLKEFLTRLEAEVANRQYDYHIGLLRMQNGVYSKLRTKDQR